MSALTPTGGTRKWRRIRAAVLNRDHHQCQVPLEDGICGEPATHAGHIHARHHGGDDDPTNLRAECAHHSHSGGATIAGNRYQPTTAAPSRWYQTSIPLIHTRGLRRTR